MPFTVYCYTLILIRAAATETFKCNFFSFEATFFWAVSESSEVNSSLLWCNGEKNRFASGRREFDSIVQL